MWAIRRGLTAAGGRKLIVDTATTTATAALWKKPSWTLPQEVWASTAWTRRFSSHPSTPSPPSFRRRGGGGSTHQGSRRNPKIPPYIWIGGVGLPVVGVTYLYVSHLDQVPLTHRRRWIVTSPEWERKMGDDEYQKLLRHYNGQILPKDHRATLTVQRVGHRIYQAAQEFCKDEYGDSVKVRSGERTASSPPTFTVIHSDVANAFVLPNNHIFVMTGLFRYARTEEELASILGHEMAHNLARHVGEKISGNIVVQLLARFSLLIDPSGSLMMLILPAATLLRDLPHSRIQEFEADQIGMHLAARACYDPAAAKIVFSRMKLDETNSRNGGTTTTPPEFLSTHPSHDSRLKRMDDWIPEAQKILNRDGGIPCHRIRLDIEQARRIAAHQAAERERFLLQRTR